MVVKEPRGSSSSSTRTATNASTPPSARRARQFLAKDNASGRGQRRGGPLAQQYHDLIAADVRKDTRKLDPTEDFEKSLTTDIAGSGFGPFGGGTIGLKNFCDQRRKFLLAFDPRKRASLER